MAKKKTKKQKEIHRLIDVAKKTGVQDQDMAAEIIKTYEAIADLERSKIARAGIKEHRQAAGKNSITALKKVEKDYMAICQTVSQTWNSVSGKIAVAAFCYSLDNRGILWELEAERPDVSTSAIDVLIYSADDDEIYVELKWTARERMGQIVTAYKNYTGDKAFVVTSGSDFTQSKVDDLSEGGIKSIPLDDPRGLTNIYTIKDLYDSISYSANAQKTA